MNIRKFISLTVMGMTCIFSSFPLDLFAFTETFHTSEESQQDQYIQALASLVYYLGEQEDKVAGNPSIEDEISFSEEEVALLWNKIAGFLDGQSLARREKFQEAYASYETAQGDLFKQDLENAKDAFKKAHRALSLLWIQACEEAFPSSLPSSFFLRKSTSSAFENCRKLPKNIKKKMRPYVIPIDHPMKERMDQIFQTARATLNQKTFDRAGFTAISIRPRTHIWVASHPLLPDYLVKLYLDSELREKKNKPSWRWLIQRCEGAEKVQHIIKSKKIKHFTVAKKWIYPLPDDPAPPKSSQYTRHLAVLLVTDMHLTPHHINLDAWRHRITEKHLDELYTIISHAKGSSYRPDNISYTTRNQFAFIDTEYPSQGPDYKSIRGYLRSDMREYWDQLVKRGGK